MKRLLCFVAFAVGCLGTLRAQPEIPPHTVFKPTFLLSSESFYGGTAFAAKVPGSEQPVMVTCHHLFGPATGLDSQMSADDIQKNIVAAVGVSMSDPRTVLIAPRYLKVAGARAFDDNGADKDLALFEFPQAVKTLTIAAKPAKVGDKVWLLARLRGTERLALHPATVSLASAKEVDYVFEKNNLELRGTSGAPVLSESGEVVAINLGGGPDKGRLIGIGNPAASILAALPRRN
ncbi:MAG: serine protease [Verrucomicrobiota bacterium]